MKRINSLFIAYNVISIPSIVSAAEIISREFLGLESLLWTLIIIAVFVAVKSYVDYLTYTKINPALGLTVFSINTLTCATYLVKAYLIRNIPSFAVSNIFY